LKNINNQIFLKFDEQKIDNIKKNNEETKQNYEFAIKKLINLKFYLPNSLDIEGNKKNNEEINQNYEFAIKKLVHLKKKLAKTNSLSFVEEAIKKNL